LGRGVGVGWVEGEGFFVELDGQGIVAGVHVGFGEAVVGVGGLRVKIGIELQDADGVGGAFLAEQAVAERVDGNFGDGSALEYGVELLDGDVGAFFVRDFCEAERIGVVGIVFDPSEGQMIPADDVTNDCRSDGKTVFAVSEQDHAGFVARVGDDKTFESAVIAPVPESFGIAVCRAVAFRAFDAPAKSPEKTFGEFFWRAVGAIGAFGVNGNLRCFHFAESGWFESSAIEYGGEEERVVVSAGVESGRGAGVIGLPEIDGVRVGVMAGGSECVEHGTPDVAAAGHTERGEDEIGHDVVQRLAGNLLDDGLQVDVAFAGIAEAFSGREIDFEGIVAAPVAETGAMAEHDACGDFREAIVDYVRLRKVCAERNIEAELALID